MPKSTIDIRLNDVVHLYIQSYGILYVCDNYQTIRDDYYLSKEQPSLDFNDTNEEESRN